MPRLFIFNPETDYCLASGSESYTPPANVTEVRRSLAAVPARFAAEGDALLLLDDIDKAAMEELRERLAADGIEPVSLALLRADRHKFAAYTPVPWGWNRQIRRLLTTTVGEMPGMPSAERIDEIRRLSHRRTNIKMFDAMKSRLQPGIELPAEISDPDTALDALDRHGRLFFKAPWSSSGRGVLLAEIEDRDKAALWIRGIIKRQESVMMEKAYDRKLDFATEWYCRDGKARFLGYSVFNVSFRGKYHSNVAGTQRELSMLIGAVCPAWNEHYLELQRKGVESVFASSYEGPLGVDMLVTTDGAVNPCVEVNLRHTMGMPGLLKYKNLFES